MNECQDQFCLRLHVLIMHTCDHNEIEYYEIT